LAWTSAEQALPIAERPFTRHPRPAGQPTLGWVLRYVEHDSGGYWDYCDFPLKDADVEKVANWPIPSPDDFDYSAIPADCQRWREYGVFLGNPGLACIMNTAGFLIGMSRYSSVGAGRTCRAAPDRPHDGCATGDHPPLAGGGQGRHRLPLDRRGPRHADRPDDQHGDFRKHIKPRHQPFFDLARSFNLPVMMHTCGSSSWAYDEYIPMD